MGLGECEKRKESLKLGRVGDEDHILECYGVGWM